MGSVLVKLSTMEIIREENPMLANVWESYGKSIPIYIP